MKPILQVGDIWHYTGVKYNEWGDIVGEWTATLLILTDPTCYDPGIDRFNALDLENGKVVLWDVGRPHTKWRQLA